MVQVLKRLYFCYVVLAVLASCTGSPQPQPAVSVRSPAASSVRPPAASIVAGKASLTGQAVSSTNHAPIKKAPVYLAQVYWDPGHKHAAYALDLSRSPAVVTDEHGFFSFSGVDPHEYVIFVGDYYGENDIIREKNGDARVFATEVGKLLDVGALPVKPSVSKG